MRFSQNLRQLLQFCKKRWCIWNTFFGGGGQSTAHSSTICFYYTTINFFCQVFYMTFLELFLFFVLRFQRAPCAAPRFPFTLQGRWLGFAVPILALSKKGILYLREWTFSVSIRDFGFLTCYRKRHSPIKRVTFLSPNCSTYPRCSLLSSSLLRAYSAWAL